MRDKDEKTVILIGAVIGAVSGAALAVVYGRWRRQRQIRGAKPIKAGQVVRLGVAAASVLRQFVDLIS